MKKLLVTMMTLCPFVACAQVVYWTEKSLDLGTNVAHSDQDCSYANLSDFDLGFVSRMERIRGTTRLLALRRDLWHQIIGGGIWLH